MTLTEQWKKGELPEGWYYTKIDMYEDGNIEIVPNYFNSKDFEWYFVIEVLAPVPSYDEYMTMKDCAKAVFEAAQRETKLEKDIKYYCIQNERYAIALKNASDYLRKPFPKIAEMIDEVLK